MKNKILDFLKSNEARTFYWQTANGFVLLLIGVVTVIQPDIVDPKMLLLASGGLALLNAITKYINRKFL